MLLLKPELISSRDFTDGQATKLIDEIISLGAESLQSIEELLRAIDVVVKA